MSAEGKFRRASLLSQLHGMLQSANPMWGTWCLGLLFFEDDVGFDTIKQVMNERLLSIPRFRSKYDFKKHGFVELGDDEIDFDHHFKEISEEMSLEDILQDYVGNVYKHFEVDSERPLWQALYFSKLTDGRTLFIINTHHVVGDGVSQVKTLFEMMDKDDEEVKEETTSVAKVEDAKSSPKPKKTKKKKAFSYGFLNQAGIMIKGVFGAFTSVFAKPDSTSVLMRKDVTVASIQKKIAYTEVIPLEKVKAISKKYKGATINDVLVAVLTMALRAYLEEQGATDSFSKRIRASFPINARKPGKDVFRDGSPHNDLALGTMKFPFKYKKRTEVIYKVKRTIDAVKISPEPFVQRGLGNTLLRILPEDAAAKMFAGFGNQTTAMLSNVMGPNKPLYLNGHKCVDMQFGLYSSNGIYLGLISYDGKVSCGITMDDTLGDPKDIARHWASEFEALYEETMEHEDMVPKPGGIRAVLDRF